MGRRKTILKVSKVATIKCPHCGEKSRIPVPEDASVPFYDCKKCKQRISTPLASCCIICAFSNKRCHRSLMMEAHAKKLELRMPTVADKGLKDNELNRLLFPNKFKTS